MKIIVVIIFSCFWVTKSYAQVRACVVESAQACLGVRETTPNGGKEVGQYLKSVGLNEGYAWCAAFVNFTLAKCGAKHRGSAWAPAWFPDNLITTSPKSGDVFGIYFPAKKRIAHVGFILEWGEKASCTTIEGNTNEAGSREGDGVYKKWRLKSQIYKVANWIGE